MARVSLALVPCLLLLLLLPDGARPQVAMSPCLFGRATSGYSAPPGPGGTVGGTCGIGPAQPYMPSWFASRYVVAADDETYNGYPWLSPPTYISTTGVGRACGECFELTGDVGTIRIMNVDVCDFGCPACQNCNGSQGNDLPDFDVDMAVFSQLTSGSGNVPIAYRKVSCDMPGLTMGVVLSSTNLDYFVMRPYAHVVGVASIEVKPNGGNWIALTRYWQGRYDWTAGAPIATPFQVRVTSILNETIVFPTGISAPIPSRIDSGQQFTPPPAGYGGGNQAQGCVWPGPDPRIFVNGFGGPTLLKWGDWGSYTDTAPVYTQATGCVTAPCIRIGPTSAFKAMQIGTVVGAPLSYWSNITFWARSDTATKLRVYYTGSPNSVTLTTNAAWTFYTFPNAQFFNGTGTMRVFQIMITAASTSDLFIDDIQWAGQNFARVYPVIGGLSGPPVVGFPGYTGIDPSTGLPTVGITGATTAAAAAASTSTASTTVAVTTSNTATTVAVTTTTAVTSTAFAAGGATAVATATASTTTQATTSNAATVAATSTTAVTATAFAAGGATGTTTAAASTSAAAAAAGRQQSSSSGGGGGGGLSKGAIAGIVVGVLLGVALVAVLGFFAYKHFAGGSSSAAAPTSGKVKAAPQPASGKYNITV